MSSIHSEFNLFQPIALGSDHAGFDYKEDVKRFLEARGLIIKDFGAYSKESVDYPDFAIEVARRVSDGALEEGILVCTTGVGMAMAASWLRL